MQYETFLDGYREILATFGKTSTPAPILIDAVFKRVRALPDAFMAYAVKRIQDMEKLPANFGAFLRNELWPDYLDANPQMRARGQEFSCHRCKQGSPGLKAFYSPDGETHICACDCCTDKRRIDLLGKFPDEELRARGFLTERPLREPTEIGRKLAAICASALGEHKPRPEHTSYLKNMEEPDAWQWGQ